jgi:hypothetical protein
MGKSHKAKPAPVAEVAPGPQEYRVLRPISWCGERVETGTILKMTAEKARGFRPEYLALVKETGVPAPEKAESPDEEEAKEAEGSQIDI